MDTTLLVNISGQTYQQLDLFEDIPFTLVIQQSDLTNLTGRRAPYSKTITIPDTSRNALVFEHYYEVNGVDFNPLNKLPCVVQVRGTDIFNGVLRLNSVIEKSNIRIYEIYILGEVSDFISEIRDFTLQELGWTDYTHELNYTAVTKSWEATADSTDGIFDGNLIYPMVNYGLIYSGSSTTPLFSYDFGTPTSFDLIANSVSPVTFKPAIRLKAVLDKIFSQSSYDYVSDFFDTEYFKSIYMDTFQNGKVGVDSASAVTNQNIFKTYTNPILYYNNSTVLRALNFNTESPNGFDPLGNFTLGPSNAQVAPTNQSFFRVPFNGDYGFNIRFNYQVEGLLTGFYRFTIIAVAGPDLNTLDTQPAFFTSPVITLSPADGQKTANFYFNDTLNQGDFVKVYLVCDTAFSSSFVNLVIRGFQVGSIIEPAPFWELYTSPTFVDKALVDMSLGIDNMNSSEFIKSLITMFNLVVVQDETTRQVRFEPYNWYYNNDDRPIQDWTQRVDQNSDYKISPLSFDLSKQVVWTNTFTDNEFLNKEFTERFNFVYGRYKYITENNIFEGEQEYVIPFGATPTSGVTGAPNFVIPQFYYLINGNQTPYATKPHLFFWCGNRWAYKDVNKTIPGYWYMSSGATKVQLSTYPCVSHLSSLDIQIPDLVSDLNFQSTFDFFGNSNNQILQFTPYNLYNLWWEDYVDNLYSPETRRLECRVFFNPIEVYQTSLKDRIFVKDAWYTIEKLNDVDLINRKLTQVSLIKDRTPYYKVIPPAPVYAIDWNEPYPGVEPSFYTLCYVSLDKDAVCDETAPLLLIYTFGSGTIENFDVVYYDTGTSLKKLEQGYYLRQQTGSDTFVVIDNYGRILEQDC